MRSLLFIKGKSMNQHDREAYGKLLAEIQPQVITNDDDNAIALQNIERLQAIASLTTEEEMILQLLLLLSEKYEDKQYPINSKPLDILLYLIEANNLKQADLIGIIGSSGVVSEVVNGKREISKNQALALGDRFSVDYKLFL